MRAILATCVAAGLLTACARPPEPQPAPRPLWIVGWDGADWHAIDPRLEARRMPHLAALLARGTRADLETLEPTLSPRLWTTIATGRPPEIHGITDFVEDRGGKKIPISRLQRQVKAIWNVASDAGARVAVVSWWATWPAERVRGAVVSDRAFLSAERMQRQLGRISGESPAAGEIGGETYPPELWRELRPLMWDPSRRAAADIDRFFHFTPEERRAALAGTWPSRPNQLDLFWDAVAQDRSTASVIAPLVRGGGGGQAPAGPEARKPAAPSRAGPPDLVACTFFTSDVGGHLFLPAAQESPAVDPADVARYHGTLAATYEFLDEALGKILSLAPDNASIALLSDHGMRLSEDGKVGDHHHGRPPGILVLAGPEIRRGASIDPVPLLDVAPTLFHLAGLPLSAEMEGAIVSQAFAPGALDRRPPAVVPTYGAPRESRGEARPSPVDEEILERLEGLGYLGGEEGG